EEAKKMPTVPVRLTGGNEKRGRECVNTTRPGNSPVQERFMQATATRQARQRKPRVKPQRLVNLLEAPTFDRPGTVGLTMGKEVTFYEVAPIVEAAWGRAFCVRKQDGTEYAVNLGDPAEGMNPSCDCLGHERWGGCKHRESLAALVQAGRL